LKIATIVGTRPQLIKAAALLPELRARHDVLLVDTGQHWDDTMAAVFFEELGLPRPAHSLGVGGGTHAEQTGRMLLALEPVIAGATPDAVVVFGDTNSTLAGTLAAVRSGTPVAHVEAGMRSFDRGMPEEVNRVVSDHLATWRLAPTPTAVENLAREGLVAGVTEVGDLMQDLASRVSAEIRDIGALDRAATVLARAGAPSLRERLRPGEYIFATIHRAENREPRALAVWPAILGHAASPDRPVILALHPGTRATLEQANVGLPDGVEVVEPLGYRTSLTLQLHAAAVVTDSGGVQREAAWLRTPCLVLRATTEWTEAVNDSEGRMVVVGLDRQAAARELARLAPTATAAASAWARVRDGVVPPAGAAVRIVDVLDAGAS